jgi:acyl-CoA synthetase (AMP-forming)/AMP-acid ligase II
MRRSWSRRRRARTITYAQTLAAVHRLRRALGDAPACVLLALPGGIENGLVWLSALTGGHTLLPFAPQATAHEAARLSSLFAPDVVVVERWRTPVVWGSAARA